MEEEYKDFKSFYPYYLKEHQKSGTRITHFIGTSLFFVWVFLAIVNVNVLYVLYGIITAYFFAWVGHFFIEKNKPATFRYPWMSLKGDFKLYFEIWSGKESFSGR